MRSAIRPKWLAGACIAIVLAVVTPASAMADAFGPVSYDPQSDQIIVTMIYEGTNPNHHFTFQWGRCHKRIDQPGQPAHQIINLGILDDQGNDAATRSYRETIKVPLAGISCRPATVTLWTSPKQYTRVDIP